MPSGLCSAVQYSRAQALGVGGGALQSSQLAESRDAPPFRMECPHVVVVVSTVFPHLFPPHTLGRAAPLQLFGRETR